MQKGQTGTTEYSRIIKKFLVCLDFIEIHIS